MVKDGKLMEYAYAFEDTRTLYDNFQAREYVSGELESVEWLVFKTHFTIIICDDGLQEMVIVYY